jgi:dTMP kinase
VKKPELIRGIFITLEGIEGCGKSTQAVLLAKALKSAGYRVKLTREPGGTPLGNAVRRILLNSTELKILPLSELLLYLVSRYQHVEEVIKKELKKKNIVISDRFSDSSVAYQGFGRGLGGTFVGKLDKFVTGGLKPDLTFILDCPAVTGIKRVLSKRKPDRIERENIAFHEKVRKGYIKIAEQDKKRIVIIDSTKSAEEVSKKILSVVKRRFNLGNINEI